MHPALKVMNIVGESATKLASSMAKDLLDADRMLQRSTGALIELAAIRYGLGQSISWSPGEPLRILLVGYAGTRNTGADVRVEEMIRQFRHLLGDDDVDLSIFTMDPDLTRGYFRTVKQLHMPQVFPKFLAESVRTQHGVVTCEGSMFKSKFANALSTLMVGGLGLASAENKLAIGYGGEAGAMDPPLEAMVRRYCRDSFIIARNDASVEVLGNLGVQARSGTDTAWTFEPSPADVGEKLLRQAGWDGEKPILALCPINPFWWPVQADLGKRFAQLTTGRHAREHYKSVYYHRGGEEVRQSQTTYLQAIANATNRFLDDNDYFVILVGMEQLDRKACEQLQTSLSTEAPCFVSDEYDMFDMVSVIRHANALISSRYHAIVTTMPGLVPSAGITMDERIRNLMIDRGQPELALEVDDPHLSDNLYEVLCKLNNERDAIANGIERCVIKNLVRMGEMGMAFVDHVRTHHPEFPLRPELGLQGDPWAHLPSLPEAVVDILERQRSAA